jgi:hypothetical protein
MAEEAEFSGFVDSLRRITSTVRLEPDTPASLVAHLMVRTRSLRQSFVRAGIYLKERVLEHFCDEDRFQHLIERYLRKNPETLVAMIEKSAGFLSAKQKLKVAQDLRSNLRGFLRSQMGQMRHFLEAFSCNFDQLLPSRVKEDHNRALQQQLSPLLRVQELCALQWSLAVLREPYLIISDVGPVARVRSGTFKSVTDKDEQISEIFLPLSASQVLIGTQVMCISEPLLDYFNEASAKCSFEHFVSAHNGAREMGLHRLLGGGSDLFPAETIDAICESVFSKFLA